jgi:hypothetical protein
MTPEQTAIAIVIGLLGVIVVIVIDERRNYSLLKREPPEWAYERPVWWVVRDGLLTFGTMMAALAVAGVVVDGGRPFWAVTWPMVLVAVLGTVIRDVRMVRRRRARNSVNTQ